METNLAKAELRKAVRCIEKWRKALDIDPKWRIEVGYGAEVEPGISPAFASLDTSSAEYWHATIILHEPLHGPEFAGMLDGCILHELLHLVMWQYTSFVHNMIGRKCHDELSKLEEQVVRHLEGVITKRRAK